MPLILTITSARCEDSALQRTKVFETRGGTIGRTQGNDWVLPDPERFVSGAHAKIQYRDSVYYLGDTSTNGVFVNGSSQPVGAGNFVPLRNGDRLLIGDYEISVAIEGEGEGEGASAGFAGPDDSLAADAPSPPGNPVPSAIPPAPPPSEEASGEDPFAFLDAAPLSSPAPWAPGASTATGEENAAQGVRPSLDQGTPLEDFLAPPGASPTPIPEDWDMTGFAPAASPANRRASSEVDPASDIGGGTSGQIPMRESVDDSPHGIPPTPVVTPPGAAPREEAPMPGSPDGRPFETPTSPVVTPSDPGGNDASVALGWFLHGAGLGDLSIAPDSAASLMTAVGGMFRELVQGAMEILMARSSLKSEFRMTMTTVRPAENNPLKFSVDLEEALRALLTKQGPGYLAPADAVHEAVMDIKGHQMAMMAGMQAAFRELLRRFDPQLVEQMAGKGGKLGAMMPVGRKAKCWELYGQQYKDILREAEDHFQRLFGEEFARAYEEQIEQLRGARARQS